MTTHLCEEHCICHLVWLTTSCTVSALAVKKGFWIVFCILPCRFLCLCLYLCISLPLIWGHSPFFVQRILSVLLTGTVMFYHIIFEDEKDEVLEKNYLRVKIYTLHLIQKQPDFSKTNLVKTHFHKIHSCENPFSQP